MSKITNKVTGEIVDLPSDFDGLYQAERHMKAQIEALEEIVKAIREQMQVKLTREPSQRYEGESYTAEIRQNVTKEFDVERVKDLLGDQMGFFKVKKGEREWVPFYKPVAKNVQDFLKEKLEKGLLTQADAQKYQDSFTEKLTVPFVIVKEK